MENEYENLDQIKEMINTPCFVSEMDTTNNASLSSSSFPFLTNFQTDLYNISEYELNDHSLLLPIKGEDVSNMSFLDVISYLKQKKEERKLNQFQTFKKQQFPSEVNITKKRKIKKKQKRKSHKTLLFYIYKAHNNGCLHKKILKIKRDKIKSIINEDIKDLLSIRNLNCHLNKYKILSQKYFNKENSLVIKEDLILNSKNRKFRLFDKDVVIKKIMSNFVKFLRLFLKMIFKKQYKRDLNIEIGLKNKSFINTNQTQTFLKLNLRELIKDNKIDKKMENETDPNLKMLTQITLKEFFTKYFINSNYFHSYLINKTLKSYDEKYMVSFLKHINEIIKK
jgi:hypothetical protein